MIKSHGFIFPFPNGLDPVIMNLVKPLLVRGDYETAVFRSSAPSAGAATVGAPRDQVRQSA
jgi:hypothetical protein